MDLKNDLKQYNIKLQIAIFEEISNKIIDLIKLNCFHTAKSLLQELEEFMELTNATN